MVNKRVRGALRGVEEDIFDLVAETCTSEQWAKFLKPFLKHAAARGDVRLTHKLVEAEADVGNAVHAAVRGGHGEIVRVLLENGASAGAKDADGATPLHVAAEVGRVDIARSLLLRGVDQESLSSEGRTPLNCAATHGHVGVVKALLAAGADLTQRYGEREISALDIGAGEGDIDLIRVLIGHGADVNAADSRGVAALYHAAANNQVEAIEVLLEAGANVQARCAGTCLTPLHLAAHQQPCLKAVSALLKYGAEVNAQTTPGMTALDFAAAYAGNQGAAEVVDLLLRWGADETIVSRTGKRAIDVIGIKVEGDGYVPEDVERVRKLLVNAPADRTWRRRAPLVLCRDQPDRVQLGGDWADLASRILEVVEDGVFRTIVGYL